MATAPLGNRGAPGAPAKPSPPSAEYILSPSGHSDILRPTLIKFGRRIFRKTTGRSVPLTLPEPSHPQWPLEEEEMEEDEPKCLAEKEEEERELFGARKLRSGELELHLSTPPIFFKYIIGREGQTRRGIERDTKCKVIVPRQGQSGPLVLIGPNKRSLLSAKQRIEVIVWSNRSKEGITHFLGIPLNVENVMEKFEDFERRVKALIPSIDEELFQNPIRLHVTLPVFYLFSEEEEELAVMEINSILPKAIDKLRASPATISLKGLECMNDDYSSVRVLYAKVNLSDDSPRLQEFADTLQEELVHSLPDHVLVREGRTGIKLHATVMNMTFKDPPVVVSHSNRRRGYHKREGFNASQIMKEFSDFDFGCLPLSEICLLMRGEEDPNTGFYKCIETFKIMKE